MDSLQELRRFIDGICHLNISKYFSTANFFNDSPQYALQGLEKALPEIPTRIFHLNSLIDA